MSAGCGKLHQYECFSNVPINVDINLESCPPLNDTIHKDHFGTPSITNTNVKRLFRFEIRVSICPQVVVNYISISVIVM